MSNNSLVEQANQEIGKPSAMAEERAKVIGQNVARLREAADMSQAELAKAIGVRSQNTIAQIELGSTKKSKHLPDIARALRVPLSEVDPGAATGDLFPLPEPTPRGGFEEADLPVYASVEGGEGILVWANEPVETIRRPEAVMSVRKPYAVLVVGESMRPAVRPGDVVVVHPYLQPKPEDLCIFIREEHGEFHGTLKEYCSQSKDAWAVKRYHPRERIISLPKKEWPKCQVVVSVEKRR